MNDPTRKVVDCVYLSDIVECELLEIEEESDDPTRGKELEVVIRTTEEGYSAGRSYIYKSEQQDAIDWEVAVDKAVAEAKRRQRDQQIKKTFGHSKVAIARAKCRLLLKGFKVRACIALVIFLAFFVDMLEAQYLPVRGSAPDLIFFAIDSSVTLFFVIELMLNVFAFSHVLGHYFGRISDMFAAVT